MEKILKKLKKLLRLIFGRTTLGTLFLLIQILVLFAGFDWFREYLIYMYGGSAILSALILIYIISDEGNSTIKLSWVVPISGISSVWNAVLSVFDAAAWHAPY